MKRTLERAWNECLELWEVLSMLPDVKGLRESQCDFYGNLLKKQIRIKVLGHKTVKHGCPLCQYYSLEDNGTCIDCPLGDGRRYEDNEGCKKTPFHIWKIELCLIQKHSQEYAKKFFKHLLEIHGYYEVK